MHKPRLTLVVPIYNGKKYLSETLHSIEGIEDSIACEVIFQNSCSTDGTTELLDAFCKGRENRYHFNEKDTGQSDAINRGVGRAKGKWVTWLCADDIILPAIVEALDEADEMQAEIVYGDVVFLSSSKLTPAIGTERYSKGVLARKRLVIQQPGTCILRHVWEEMEGVQLDLNWTMDYDLFMRMETVAKKFHRYRGFLAVIRVHPDAKTSSGSFARIKEMYSIIWKSHRRCPSFFRCRPYVIYGVEYIIKALEQFASRRPASALKWFLKGLHRFFWVVAQPAEYTEITTEFNKNQSWLRNVVKINETSE